MGHDAMTSADGSTGPGTKGADGPAVTVVRAPTPRGEVALRERRVGGQVVHELVVAGVFAMDSRDTSTETALAQSTLELVDDPARVLVGGLGLGYTALAAIKDRRVRRLDVVEVEEDLLAWARLALTPTLGLLARHPRVTLHAGDVADALVPPAAGGAAGLPTGPWDLVLLDVDNGPGFLVHPANSRLYTAGSLRSALGRVAPGGALAVWAAQREPDLLATLADLAPTQETTVTVAREGRELEYAIYVARP